MTRAVVEFGQAATTPRPTRGLAVAIGVGRIEGLPFLPGVYRGLDEFVTWARSQGFQVIDFSDVNGSPVDAGDVAAAIAAPVQQGGLERLFVYFAGHGIGTGGETWLLTDAMTDSNAGINVTLSMRNAQRSGVRHVAFFADACRTPEAGDLLDTPGQAILPKVGSSKPTRLDLFFATKRGEVAYESPPGPGAHGYFSMLLLAALRGEVPAAVKSVVGGDAPHAVVAKTLRDYLETEVPRLVDAAGAQVQWPSIQADSDWEPDVLAWLPDHLPSEADVEVVAVDSLALATVNQMRGLWAFETEFRDDLIDDLPSSRPRRRRRLDPNKLAASYGFAPRPASERPSVPAFARRLSRSEQLVAGLLVDHYRRQLVDPPYSSARSPLDGPIDGFTSAGGGWAPTPRMPGYFPELILERTLEPLVCCLATGAPLASGRALPEVLAADRMGRGAELHRVDPLAASRASSLTEAILRSYWGADTGRFEEVANDAWAWLDEHGWVSFDQALLGELPLDEVPVVPSFPLVARGWALIEGSTLPEERRVELSEARRHLRRGRWTLFEFETPRSVLASLARRSREAELE